MKQTLTRYSLVASFIFILLSFNVDSILVRFLLAGELPGTTIILSPGGMLIIIGMIAVLSLGLIISKEYGTKFERQIQAAKRRLPKRRYSSVS